MDSSRLRDIIIGIALLAVGCVTLLHTLNVIVLDETMTIWAGIYGFAGLGAILLIFSMFRSDLVWVMIIAFCLFFLASTIWVLNFASDDTLVGVALFLLNALAFLLVFLRDRGQWWALIVTWTSLGLAAVVFMQTKTFAGLDWTWLDWSPQMQGLVFLASVALGFFFVWLANVRTLWWALMTAGLTAGVCVPAAGRVYGYSEEIGAAGLFLVAGLTFFLLWLIRNNENKLGWAIYPASVLLPFSAFLYLILVWRGHEQITLSLLFIIIGLIFILTSFLGRIKREAKVETDRYRVYSAPSEPSITVMGGGEPPYVEEELPRPATHVEKPEPSRRSWEEPKPLVPEVESAPGPEETAGTEIREGAVFEVEEKPEAGEAEQPLVEEEKSEGEEEKSD